MSTPPKKVDRGSVISSTLFWVFLILFCLGLYQSIELNALRGEYSAPENLRTAAESFRLSLAVEQSRRSSDTSDLWTTEAWRKLEKNLDGYAKRLEMMQAQDWKRQMLLNLAYAGSAFAMFICTMRKKWAPEILTLQKRLPTRSDATDD
jgi:hypothetical protein